MTLYFMHLTKCFSILDFGIVCFFKFFIYNFPYSLFCSFILCLLYCLVNHFSIFLLSLHFVLVFFFFFCSVLYFVFFHCVLLPPSQLLLFLSSPAVCAVEFQEWIRVFVFTELGPYSLAIALSWSGKAAWTMAAFSIAWGVSQSWSIAAFRPYWIFIPFNDAVHCEQSSWPLFSHTDFKGRQSSICLTLPLKPTRLKNACLGWSVSIQDSKYVDCCDPKFSRVPVRLT